MTSIIKQINKNVETLIKELEKIIEDGRKEIEENAKTKTRQTQIKNLSYNKRRRIKQSKRNNK